jgi:tetratricopeptide (TPR) repeat protein
MAQAGPSVEALLGLAIRHVNAGQPERARILCEQATRVHPPHPAVLQLLATIDLQQGEPERARSQAEASLALRPDHAPTQRLLADAWFQLSLRAHDLKQLDVAAAALRNVLRLAPERAEAEVNLAIVLQEGGRLDEAMQAYGRAYRLREDTFGRIAHALSATNVGKLWLRLDDLRAALRAAA